MEPDVVLVANRGEIAVRVLRAARELGLRTVAVHPRDDAAAMHVALADGAHELPGAGPAAYLDQDAVVAAAQASGATLLHPGYGFLSENSGFAARCAAEGLRFVGPSPEVLALFGDKVVARATAHEVGIPVLPATTGPTDLDAARAFAAAHGAVMVKAVAGGGGRGMRPVQHVDELAEAFERCAAEARQAFGDGSLYVEQLLTGARHVEVQIVGDGTGWARHLWERDCSVQRRHQKLVEIAPAPALDARTREVLLAAAVRLAEHVRYGGVGTVEFLVGPNGFVFVEANPRLQVEHTVTEEITGVDLVAVQLGLARGRSPAELGLDDVPEPRGFAVQARVNAEELGADGEPLPKAGTLTVFGPPTGPNVRVDTHGYAGYRTSSRYDSLLAKVIGRGRTFAAAVATTEAALGEFRLAGVPTNAPLLRAVLRHPAFGGCDTGFVAEHLAELREAAAALPTAPLLEPAARPAVAAPEPGADAVAAPMDGTVVAVAVAPGERVAPGTRVAIVEAMKMEFVVRAEVTGVVSAVSASSGDVVVEGAPLVLLDAVEPGAGAITDAEPVADGPGWAAEVAEIERRRELAAGHGGPAKVARQHAAGKLTARERIALLADPGTFTEIAPLAGFATYADDGTLTSFAPTNFIGGTARVDGRTVVIGADDFTIRGGSGDGAIHGKQIHLEQYAGQMRLPVVRLLDGASGGGSVKMAIEAGHHYVPVNPGWDAVVANMSLVPVVAACLGPTVGLGAARLVTSHLAVLVAGIGQVFTAGPPVVLGSTGEDLTKEQLGGVAVHRANGVVERIVATEQDALDVVRRFLGYLPSSVFGVPPVAECADPPDRRDDVLLHAVPRDTRAPYRIGEILDAIFDRDSVLPYAEYGGATVTALARLDGHPVGVIANDPLRGATISAEGAQAITRLVDLCETFHLPIVSLTDQGGNSIGAGAERRATIRYGARAIAAVYQARVPQAELIVRRVFGVGGAGIVNRHRAGRTWAWPSGNWGSLPARGGIEAAFRAHLDTVPDRDAEIERISRELALLDSPFRTAEHFGVQDLIDPRDSRALLCDWVRDAYRLLPELLGPPAFGARP